MSNLIRCAACCREVSTAAKQCMHCGHPVKHNAPYNWPWIAIAAGMLLVVAVGAYRILPILLSDSPTTTAGSPKSSQANDSAFGANSLPEAKVTYIPPPSGGRVASKRELSAAAQKLDAAAAPYWNHVYKIDRIYYSPEEHTLNIDYLVREAFEEVDRTMLHAIHQNSFCTSAAHAIFRLSGVTAQWSFRADKWGVRADKDNELLHGFKILGCESHRRIGATR